MYSRIFLKLCLFSLVLIVTPTCVRAQRDSGGGSSRGGFDVGAYFDRVAGKAGYIDIAKSGRSRQRFEEFAKKNGITNGRLNKDQFVKYMAERMKQRSSGDSKSGDSKSGDRSRGSDRGRREYSEKEKEAYVKRKTDGYFYSRDRNKDKYLDTKEMSEKLKARLKEFDKNRDGKISYQEAHVYIRGYYVERLGLDKKSSSSQSSSTGDVDQSILDQRPTVFRAGHLPDDLKDTYSWFVPTDVDKDGQVGLYEWRGTDKDLDEFDKYDRNLDGFLTAEEMLFYKHHIAKVGTSENDKSSSSSSSKNSSSSNSSSSQNGGSDRSRFGNMRSRFGRGGSSGSDFGSRFGRKGRGG